MMRSASKRPRPVMNTSDWFRLPSELQERIFALLPVSLLLKCRRVCKDWRSLLTSPNFLRHWTQVAAPVPWFLMFRDHKFRAYSPSLGIWQDIPVSSEFDLTCIVASAGGLLFLSSQKKKKGSPPLLLVCNPLTMSCRILPKPGRVSLIYVMGMVADNGMYKILVAGVSTPSSKELVTEIYDSSLGAWEYQGSTKLDVFRDFSGMRAVYSSGFFYCLSVPPYKLVAYDLTNRTWIKLGVQAPMNKLTSASLFVCQERLMLAGKLMQGGSLKEIQIWELKNSLAALPAPNPVTSASDSNTWQELANRNKINNTVLGEFCKCLTYFMALQRPKGLDSVCFNSWCRWRTLMYDVSQKTWNWLPEHCGRFKDMLSGLTYEPTFLARA